MIQKFFGCEQIIQGLNNEGLQLRKPLRVFILCKLVDDPDFIVDLSCDVVGLDDQDVLGIGLDGTLDVIGLANEVGEVVDPVQDVSKSSRMEQLGDIVNGRKSGDV